MKETDKINRLKTDTNMSKKLVEVLKKELTELHMKLKTMIKQQMVRTVTWFNMKNRYGFINCNDTSEDIFVHRDH